MSKAWLITGSASGIGKGIAHAALAAGDRVVATDLDLARLHACTRSSAPAATRS